MSDNGDEKQKDPDQEDIEKKEEPIDPESPRTPEEKVETVLDPPNPLKLDVKNDEEEIPQIIQSADEKRAEIEEIQLEEDPQRPKTPETPTEQIQTNIDPNNPVLETDALKLNPSIESTNPVSPVPAGEPVFENPSPGSTESLNTKEVGSNESLAVSGDQLDDQSDESHTPIEDHGETIYDFAEKVPDVLKIPGIEKDETDLEQPQVIEEKEEPVAESVILLDALKTRIPKESEVEEPSPISPSPIQDFGDLSEAEKPQVEEPPKYLTSVPETPSQDDQVNQLEISPETLKTTSPIPLETPKLDRQVSETKPSITTPGTPKRKTSNISFGDVKYFKYEAPEDSPRKARINENPLIEQEGRFLRPDSEVTETDEILDAIVASQDQPKDKENLENFLNDQSKIEPPKAEEKEEIPKEEEYISYVPPKSPPLPLKLKTVRQDLPDSRDIDSPAAETPVDAKSKFKYPLLPALKGAKKPGKETGGEAWSKDVHMEAKPSDEEKVEVAAIFKMSPRKQVSILVNKPPSDENIPERRKLMADPFPKTDTESDFNEKTPLLASSSLPTIVGEDGLPIHPSALEAGFQDNPISSTRSEGGGPTNRRRRRRIRCRSEGIYGPVKSRPLIASPFMPIPMRKSTIDLERRSTVTREPRPARPASYGSLRTPRRAEEAPILPPTTSEESESETDSEVSRKISFRTLSSRDWVTISMLAVANLCSTIAFSCIAPFYPKEATLKGMTESETGIVFGIFELMMFVTAPLFGKFMTKIGSKNMFTMGLAITGVTAICFGFLNFLPSGRLFFWASLLIRVLEAVGDAAFVTSSFAISAKLFPGNVASIVGIMETFAGLGYTAGPLVGGFLYEYGGFQTPFMVLGGILLIATLLSICTVDAIEDDVDEVDTEKGMLQMLKIPLIWIMSYAVVVCAISLSFLDPTLEAHLRTYSLSPTLVGLMFLLCGGVYTLSAPFWGVLIDKFDCSTFIMFFGSAATAVSMMIIGPSPLIPIEKNLFVIGFALCILGVAAGALYIPTFQNCLDAVKEYDFDDSIYTYGCVSGIFQSSFAFGGFIGPTLGGAAVEWIGFEWTATAIAAVNFLFIITLLCYFGGRQFLNRRRSISN